MKKTSMLMILFFFWNNLEAQQADSLQTLSPYEQAWQTAMADGKISKQERALLDVFSTSLLMTPDSVQSLESLWTLPPQADIDQSGRWPLVAQNMALGAGLYGWGIPYVLHADDFRWFTGSEMLSLGTAFYLTYKYTEGKPVTHSQTQMMRYGSLLGLRYGAGLNQLLGLDGGESHRRETLWMWVLMGSVPLGHYGGEYLFDKYEPSNGQAWVWTMWTGVAGLTTRLIYNSTFEDPSYSSDCSWYEDDYEDCQDKIERWEKRRTLTELAAYPLGALYGYKLTKDKQYSFGDAMMMMQGWGYGFFNAMLLQSLLFDIHDDEAFMMVAGLGGIGGAFAYDRIIRDDDYSFGQSILMLLGSASGTAFGFGTAILFEITDKEPMLSLALAGYGTGTWLTHSILDLETDGALAHSGSTRMSLTPSVIPSMGNNERVSLIPALDLRISFK